MTQPDSIYNNKYNKNQKFPKINMKKTGNNKIQKI